ncbi:hypothetical protein PPERSA_10382 [Pseudocohnilembus persalinus]|uniref:Transmembrane protein n=1 Tax=Pseudocohnilembus persalinus TaxID=266149 RepID=A0A0V0R226_PSEPJ|nr:hypothetical protein PPERSA_10382 [Pseudocohnilembus persalinus]|eukprot:KRX08578.1 hypothetical protein PPERSA_10382 [Pseudocohnilembus persalinus]
MKNYFFRKNNQKYLRKKSALLQDYISAGIFASIFGFLIYRYNKSVDPTDLLEEQNDISVDRNPLDYVDSQIKKMIHVYSDFKKTNNNQEQNNQNQQISEKQ